MDSLTIQGPRLTDDFEWRRVRRRLLDAAGRLSDGNASAVAALLEDPVIVRLPGGTSRSLSRSAAAEALAGWRGRWQTCEVAVDELLWSGPLLGATCRVTGLRWGGVPTSVDLALTWSPGAEGVRRVDFLPPL